jgi:cyclophilin family peptidyl-prolyl cis-trans isomerase
VAATVQTNMGTFTIAFEREAAPNTVANFERLTTQGFYDGVIFHRIIPGFVVQGGDPTGTGSGGPGYKFADELPGPDLDYDRYVVAMANAGPNTNGSQWFICTADLRGRLPKNYTIFGRVSSGFDVVDRIAAVPADARDRPLDEVKMVGVSLTDS